ncbi:MAG: tetratricopeptide repeat protein, partial [Candidatus Aminicenantes bacterium]|nr:tetratricopeptide repeat protein [Candidatus Aminicenantes bacterium]
PKPSPQAAIPPVSILVADIKNQTGDPDYDGSLEYPMEIGLEVAPFITVYKRPNAMLVSTQLNPGAKGRLDAETAQLVCVREGINLFMDGAIEPRGNGYVLKIWSRDPLNPEKATEYSKDIPSKKDVLTAAAWLSNKIITDLGGTPVPSAQELAGETFTTSSLPAIKAYTKAQELSIIGKPEEAMQEYLKIIQIDPNFGRAYSGLAILYRNRGQYAEGEKYFNLALAKIDQMGEREKFRTMGMYYLKQRNSQKAIQEYTELLAKYPADFSGRINLATAHFYAHNFSEAKKFGRQAVEVYPNNSMSRFNLSWYALADSDIEMAEEEAQKAIDQSPKYEKAYVVLALSKFLKGEASQAPEIYDKLRPISAVGASLALLGMTDIALYEGRLSRAVELLENEIIAAEKAGRKEYLENKWALLAQVRLQNKKISSALEAANRASGGDMGTLIYAALFYAETGQEERARSQANELSKQLGPEPRAYAKIIEGEILKKQGKIREAIVLFNQAQETLDTWLGRFSLGKAYLGIEAYPDAYKELDSCLKRRGETASIFFNDVSSIRYLPLIYYYRGRAQEGLKSDAAKESYQEFLRIKANADKGDPLVEDCLKRLASSKN